MMRIDGKEVTRLTSGGLTDVRSYNNRNTANNCCEKSAEAIVDASKRAIYESYNNRKDSLD